VSLDETSNREGLSVCAMGEKTSAKLCCCLLFFVVVVAAAAVGHYCHQPHAYVRLALDVCSLVVGGNCRVQRGGKCAPPRERRSPRKNRALAVTCHIVPERNGEGTSTVAVRGRGKSRRAKHAAPLFIIDGRPLIDWDE
jgi:hypothetical protein